MGSDSTITVPLSLDLSEKLDRLSQVLRRTEADIAAKAIEAYVRHETEIVEGILRGIADMEAGRVTPHDEAMAQIKAAIAEARADHAALKKQR